jgi:hypothetical protein
VDMNIIGTDAGRYVEIQGTAESAPFSREQMDDMLRLANDGLQRLFEVQRQALGDSLRGVMRPAPAGAGVSGSSAAATAAEPEPGPLAEGPLPGGATGRRGPAGKP